MQVQHLTIKKHITGLEENKISQFFFRFQYN